MRNGLGRVGVGRIGEGIEDAWGGERGRAGTGAARFVETKTLLFVRIGTSKGIEGTMA